MQCGGEAFPQNHLLNCVNYVLYREAGEGGIRTKLIGESKKTGNFLTSFLPYASTRHLTP